MKIKFYSTCIFLCVIYLTNAQSQKNYLDSAKKYEDAKQFTTASIFYERLIFEPENQEEYEKAVIGKIECLKSQFLYLNTINFIKFHINQIINNDIKYKLYEQWILLCYLTNQYEEGLSLIETTKLNFPELENKKWLCFLKIISLNEQNNWHNAKNVLRNWLINNKEDTLLLNVYNNIPKLKNENKASWLATLIPGAGLVYVNNYQEALASILLQATGLFYGFVSFQSKYYLSSWLVGLGTFGSFHFGGVRRTEILVRDYNLKKTIDFNKKIKNELIKYFGKA